MCLCVLPIKHCIGVEGKLTLKPNIQGSIQSQDSFFSFVPYFKNILTIDNAYSSISAHIHSKIKRLPSGYITKLTAGF